MLHTKKKTLPYIWSRFYTYQWTLSSFFERMMYWWLILMYHGLLGINCKGIGIKAIWYPFMEFMHMKIRSGNVGVVKFHCINADLYNLISLDHIYVKSVIRVTNEQETPMTDGLCAHDSILLFILMLSGNNFAHVTTAQLSWHVQNCDLIRSLFFFT